MAFAQRVLRMTLSSNAIQAANSLQAVAPERFLETGSEFGD